MEQATKKPIIKRTEQEKLQLIEQWEKSGLPIKTFCLQNNFSDSLFHSWLNKYRRGRKAGKQKNEFIPLPISAPSFLGEDHCSLYAEVVLASGSRIKLYQPVGVDFLRTLIA